MNKLILALTISATAFAALPANAAPLNAQSSIQAGNQCFRSTDSARGYGYWTSCDQVYAFVLGRRGIRTLNNEVLSQIERGTDGGGGDGGSGGGGGQR